MMIPDRLKKEGIRFILVRKKGKEPFEKNWQKDNNYSFNHKKLIKHIKNRGNYGVLGGYGNLLIIDFDNQEFQEKYLPKLPETFTVKTGGGKYHLYYICDDPFSKKVFDKEKNNLADIQGIGKQVIGPGSIHPNGNEYLVEKDVPITKISKNNLCFIFSDYLKEEFEIKTNQDQEVREIKNKISLVDLLDKYGYDIRKNPTMCRLGHESKGGKCFNFNVDKKLWYCFHCDEGGDVFSFIMKHDNVDFITAKKKLSKIAGVELKENNQNFFLAIDNYQDNALKFYDYQPFFYDKTGMFWFWNKNLSKYEPKDDIDVMNSFDKILGFKGQTINNKIKSNTLEGMKRIGRDKIPKEAKKKWIQFKDKAYSIFSGKIHKVTPDYFFTNPIPWEIGMSEDTPIIDKLFTDWVGKEDKETLYEIIAYCCLSDYPIHLIFCLIGCGRNGKSKFIGLLNKFIGKENICSTELDTLLDSRFESFKLYRKLLCCLGETNFGILKKTSLLKKLSGQDLIGFEYKQKVPFDDYNYAKIVISSNSLPTSEDTSEGFYRRWLIVDFPNTFPEGKDILKTIPEFEYNNLCKKVMNILPKLLEKGEFSNQGDIEERKERYILSSNPLPKFITSACVKSGDYFVKYSELYTAYVTFLGKMKKRVVSKREFGAALVSEGYEISHTSKKINNVWVTDRYILGLELLADWESFITFNTFNPKISLNSLSVEKSSENRVESVESYENLEIEEEEVK